MEGRRQEAGGRRLEAGGSEPQTSNLEPQPRSSWALTATITVERLMSSAAAAGARTIPAQASTFEFLDEFGRSDAVVYLAARTSSEPSPDRGDERNPVLARTIDTRGAGLRAKTGGWRATRSLPMSPREGVLRSQNGVSGRRDPRSSLKPAKRDTRSGRGAVADQLHLAPNTVWFEATDHL